MTRRTRTLLPTSSELLKPAIIDESLNFQKRVKKQAEHYSRNAKDLQPLQEGHVVRMKPLIQGQKGWQKAIVTRRLDDRSYLVETNNGVYRRNRAHLRKTLEPPPETFLIRTLLMPRALHNHYPHLNRTIYINLFLKNHLQPSHQPLWRPRQLFHQRLDQRPIQQHLQPIQTSHQMW